MGTTQRTPRIAYSMGGNTGKYFDGKRAKSLRERSNRRKARMRAKEGRI